jgi:death-on-curing protein
MKPVFLTVEEVLGLHRDLIARFGGADGLLSRGALESALAQPSMEAFGQLLHPTLAEQAAAYLFHVVAGHAFRDGNKRIGLHCCLVFASTSGAEILGTPEDWYQLVMELAAGRLRKEAVADRVRQHLAVPDG